MTERHLAAPPARVFEAFARPDQLARWWGPKGFTSTFHSFDFVPGGRWKFTMHGPKNANFENEQVFLEIEPAVRLVLHHVSMPRYVMTITLTPYEEQTRIAWEQRFEDAAVAERIRHIVEPANEQNLDRLAAILDGRPPE